jgi:hypothetical protein
MSVAFTHDRYEILLPEAGMEAAARLEALRAASRLAEEQGTAQAPRPRRMYAT